MSRQWNVEESLTIIEKNEGLCVLVFQVRYFRTDDEEKWMMWYNGYSVEGSQAVPVIPHIGNFLEIWLVRMEAFAKAKSQMLLLTLLNIFVS